MKRKAALLSVLACGCGHDQVRALVFPASVGRTLLMASRSAGETSIVAASVDDAPFLLPSPEGSVTVQVAFYERTLAELGLARGRVTSKDTPTSSLLPPPLAVFEAAYDAASTRPFEPASVWAELRDLRIDPPDLPCSAVQITEVELTVTSTSEGAMTLLPTADAAVLVGYGAPDYFLVSGPESIRRLRGPAAPTALWARSEREVLVGDQDGRLTEASLTADLDVSRTSTAHVGAIRRIVTRGAEVFTLDDGAQLRHFDGADWFVVHTFSFVMDGGWFLGGLVVEPDGTVVAAQGDEVLTWPAVGSLSVQDVGRTVGNAVYAPALGTTLIAGGPGNLGLFARTSPNRVLTNIGGYPTAMAASDSGVWVISPPGSPYEIVLGRRQRCPLPVEGRQRQVVARSGRSILIASRAERGRAQLSFVSTQ